MGTRGTELRCSTRLATLHRLKMGVVADMDFLSRAGSTRVARKKIISAFSAASVPFRRQFNIEIVPWVILFGDGLTDNCADPGKKDTLSNFNTWQQENHKGKFGGWFAIVSCFDTATVGRAYLGQIGSGGGPTGCGKLDKDVIAHEIGHMFGMSHNTGGTGLMRPFVGATHREFHENGANTSFVCPHISRMAATDNRDSTLVAYDEMWDTSSGLLGYCVVGGLVLIVSCLYLVIICRYRKSAASRSAGEAAPRSAVDGAHSLE